MNVLKLIYKYFFKFRIIIFIIDILISYILINTKYMGKPTWAYPYKSKPTMYVGLDYS
jgi:hypothetical protein